MPEEIVANTSEVPGNTSEVSQDTNAVPNTETPVASPDQSTAPAEETFTKMDLKTFSPKELATYKKLQADFTRARQADTQKTKQLEEKIKSFEPLLSDRDVQAKAYFIQNGKYPEGYQLPYAAQQPKPEEPKEPPMDLSNETPVVQAIYNNLLQADAKLKEYESKEQRRLQEETKNIEQQAVKDVGDFYNGLKPEQQKLFAEVKDNIHKDALALVDKGIKVADAVKKAFYSNCYDKLVELGKLEALNGKKKKTEIPRPENGLNAGGEITPAKEINSPMDAFLYAEEMVANKNK